MRLRKRRNNFFKKMAFVMAALISLGCQTGNVYADSGNEAYGQASWAEGDYSYVISHYKAGSEKSAAGNRIISTSGEMSLGTNDNSYWGDLTSGGFVKGNETWVELFRGYVPAGTILKIHMNLHSCEHKKNTHAGIRVAKKPTGGSDAFRKVNIDCSGVHPMWSTDGWNTFSETSAEMSNVKELDLKVTGNDKQRHSDIDANLTYECEETGEYRIEVYGFVQHCGYGTNTFYVGGQGDTGVVPIIPAPVGEVAKYHVEKGSAGAGTSMKMLRADGTYEIVCAMRGGDGAASKKLSGDHACPVLAGSSFGGKAPENGYYEPAKGGGMHDIFGGGTCVETKAQNGAIFGRILLVGEGKFTPSVSGGPGAGPSANLTPIPAIRFHANRGSGEMSDEVFASGFEGARISPCAYRLEGKDFVGWSIQEQGGEVVFVNQSPITQADFLKQYRLQRGKEYAGGMLNLYAVWK